MDDTTYVRVKITDEDDIQPCDKLPWQLMLDSWILHLTQEEKERVIREFKYVIEVLENKNE